MDSPAVLLWARGVYGDVTPYFLIQLTVCLEI